MKHENSENNENTEKVKGKDRLIRIFSNRRYVVAGLIAVICIGGLITIGVLSSEGEKIESFAQRWKSAVESKDAGKYRKLWDPSLRDSKEAKQQYEEAVKRTRSYDKIVAQVKTLAQRKDPRNPDLYQIESIPVELFKEKQLLMRTYRDLVVKRKRPRKRWYLVRDQERRDQQEFPQRSQEMMAGTEAEGTITTTEESTLTGSGKTSGTGTEQTAIIGEAPFGISGSSTPVDTQLKIKQVLGAWQGSWQNEDIQTYMAQYAEEARITRVTVIDGKEVRRKILSKARLRQGMERLNKRYSKIEVLISNLQINGDTAVADVGFLQTYKAFTPASGNRPAYRDFGTKSLVLAVDAENGRWKIYKESWKNYKDVPEFPKL